MPSPYADRPTAHLQARRAALIAIPRAWTFEESCEARAIERELQARKVLSIGLRLLSPATK